MKKPPMCAYIEWDKKTHELVQCHNPYTKEYNMPFNMVCKKHQVRLCQFHAEWVRDCADNVEAII